MLASARTLSDKVSLRSVVASILAAGVAAAASGDALAQSTADSGPASESEGASALSSVTEIVVTGSRIRSNKLQSISPVTSTSSEDIKITGAVNVEAVLRELPEAFPGRGASTNNNGNGDTSANLRNLGPERTLVLIDGKRHVSSDSKGNVDLDVIPPGMIERIDVVTGGASAVYGADAVAGVVNVILKKNFEGFQIDSQYAQYGEGDGGIADVSLIAGSGFADGLGNLTAFVGYTDREEVMRADRDWAFPQLITNGTSLVPFRNQTIPNGRVLETGSMFTADRTLVPYDGSSHDNASTQFLIVPQRRIALGLTGHYEATPWSDIYFRGTYSQNKVQRQVSDGASFLAPVTVNYGNPLLSDQQRSVLFGPGPHAADDTTEFTLRKSMVANGNIGERNTYDTFQLVLGVTGKIGSHFNYDLSTQYGETTWQQQLYGDISPSRFQQGLLVNPDGSCINPANGCVPIDIFTAAPGAITAAQVSFINLTQQADSETRQSVTTGSIYGDLGGIGAKSPFATSAVGIAFGGEYRRESSNYTPDNTLNIGDNVVFGSIPALRGEYDVSEVFFEVIAPLIEERPWIHSLQLEGGYRHSSYNLAGDAETYKYGGSWQPVQEVRFRGAYERAVRAPNIGELFTSPQPQSATGIDPCFATSDGGPGASSTLCQQTGVPLAAYGDPNLQCPNGICRVFTGGNTALELEVADSRTFGVAYEPSFVPGLSLSLDYYDIKVRGAISTLGTDAQPILDRCYGTGAGQNPSADPNNIFCQAIQRSPAGDLFTGGHNGSVGHISLLNENIGFISVTGIDYAASYSAAFDDLGWSSMPGTFSISTKAAQVSSYKTQASPTVPESSCAGTFGLTCGQPIPTLRLSTRLTWAPIDTLPLSLRWRYISSVVLDRDRFSGTITDPPDHRLPRMSYFDLSATWQPTDSLTLRAGVNNVLDKEPPRVSRTIASAFIFGFSNTFPGTYDLGRQLFIGANYDF